ncbi:hypothetical protein ACJRO7_008896 [Eucalyptus globulus]|uniref:Uncharacterized protein n=1 Tax=Eucalyptus globulus TaxID=34317 RepID=A0ABD3ITD5_EUCGL
MKFLRVGAILLFLVGTLVQPKEACRVLTKGKEEVWANDQPSVLVLQTLQKGKVPTPGGPGYTPGPKRTASTTNTRAFAGQAMAPPRMVNLAAFQSHGAIANHQ